MSAVRNVAISVLGNAVAPLTALAAAPVLAQTLGAAGRGEAGAAVAPLALLGAGLTLGVPEAATYFAARKRLRHRTIVEGALVLLGLGAVGTIATVVAAPGLSGGSRELAALMGLCCSALLPALLISGVRGLVAGKGRWGLIAVERTVSASARLGVLVGLAAAGALTVQTASLVLAFVPLIGGLAYIGVGGARSTERVPFSEFFSFGVRIWPGSLSGILLARLDQVVILPLSNARELGLYIVAVSVSEVSLIFNTAVRDVLFSAESAKQDAARLAQAARLSTAATAVIALVGAALAGWLVPLLFGEEFREALPALYVLLLAVVLGNPGSVAGAGLSARGRPGLRSLSIGVALAVNVALLLVLTPALGASGAALATLAGNAVAGLLNVVWLKVGYGLRLLDFYGLRREDPGAGAAVIARLLRRRR